MYNGIREKPHRLPRDCYRGTVTVSITACVATRHALFTDASLVEGFVDVLGRTSCECACRVLIYCFMPDHLHLVLQGQDAAADAWQAMVDFKQRSGFWLHRYRRGARWQKDFHDHLMRAEDDLRAHLRYVANNPVRHGLVTDWWLYPFTGAIGFDLATVLEYAADPRAGIKPAPTT